MSKIVGLLFLGLTLLGCNAGKNSKKGEDSVPATLAVEMSVDGMHCMGCVETVRASAIQLNGVTEAAVSLDSANARIVFNTGLTDTIKIKDAIELNGYQVTSIKPLKE